MPLPLLPTGIENQANAAFDEVRAAVDAMQPGYLATHGRYWQGLTNPGTIPADGAKRQMTLTRKPTDQNEDWSFFTPDATGYPIAMEVHTHGLHGTNWYTVMGHIRIAGKLYTRVNDGEWLEVIEEENV